MTLKNFSSKNGMKINNRKSKVMKFSRSDRANFPLEMSFSNSDVLETIQCFKLLGVILSENLKWDKNTDYICKKARSKIFLLRSMKSSGLSLHELIDAYTKEVRSILELAVPVWSSGLTLEQSVIIERVQKSSLSAILGSDYISYDNALKITKLERLSVRRKKICLKFVQKNVQSENSFFSLVSKNYQTRSDSKSVVEFQCRTKSFFESGLPSLARLYNKNLKKPF